MRHALFGFRGVGLFALVVTLASACTSSGPGGSGAGGTGGAGPSCTEVTPCGGSVVGTWTVSPSSCLALAGDLDGCVLEPRLLQDPGDRHAHHQRHLHRQRRRHVHRRYDDHRVREFFAGRRLSHRLLGPGDLRKGGRRLRATRLADDLLPHGRKVQLLRRHRPAWRDRLLEGADIADGKLLHQRQHADDGRQLRVLRVG